MVATDQRYFLGRDHMRRWCGLLEASRLLLLLPWLFVYFRCHAHFQAKTTFDAYQPDGQTSKGRGSSSHRRDQARDSPYFCYDRLLSCQPFGHFWTENALPTHLVLLYRQRGRRLNQRRPILRHRRLSLFCAAAADGGLAAVGPSWWSSVSNYYDRAGNTPRSPDRNSQSR